MELSLSATEATPSQTAPEFTVNVGAKRKQYTTYLLCYIPKKAVFQWCVTRTLGDTRWQMLRPLQLGKPYVRSIRRARAAS